MKKELSVPMTVLIVVIAVGLIGWLAFRSFGSGGGAADQGVINADVKEMKSADSGGGGVSPDVLSQAQGGGVNPDGSKKLPGK